MDQGVTGARQSLTAESLMYIRRWKELQRSARRGVVELLLDSSAPEIRIRVLRDPAAYPPI